MSFWETNRTHILTIGSIATIMAIGSAPWWYRLSQGVDTLEAAKVVYNCFCKSVLEAAVENCQGALDSLYGAGLGPNNVTIFCSTAGSLATVKSQAIKNVAGDALLAIGMLGVGGVLIGKYIRDVRRQRTGFHEIT